MNEKLSPEIIKAIEQKRKNAKETLAKLHQPVCLPGSTGYLETMINSQGAKIKALEQEIKILKERLRFVTFEN